MTRRFLVASGAAGLVASIGASWWPRVTHANEVFEVTYTDADWRRLLTPSQYAVLRQAATERPFTSPLLHEKRRGTFACAGCDLDLFSSTTKFDSGTGWPSFWAPLEKAVEHSSGHVLGMVRHGGALPPLRRPSWPRVRRRAESRRACATA